MRTFVGPGNDAGVTRKSGLIVQPPCAGVSPSRVPGIFHESSPFLSASLLLSPLSSSSQSVYKYPQVPPILKQNKTQTLPPALHSHPLISCRPAAFSPSVFASSAEFLEGAASTACPSSAESCSAPLPAARPHPHPHGWAKE